MSLEGVVTMQNKLNILLQVETPEHLHGVLGSGCKLIVTLWLASDSLSVQGLLPLVILRGNTNIDVPFFCRIPDFFTPTAELHINHSALTPATALNVFSISVVFLGHLVL